MSNNKILTSLVFAALIFAGLGGLTALSGSGDAAPNEGTYEIPMFAGDTFSYTPQALLSGTTITASGNGLTSNGGFLAWSNGTLSGTAAATGNRTVVLTGNWSNGGLTQTITQTINFKVYAHTTITSTSYNSGAVVGEAYSYTLAYTGNGQETVSVSTLPSWLSYNTTTKKLSGTPTAGTVGTTPSVTFTVSNAVTGDSDTMTLNLTVYADVAFTSTAPTAVINGSAYSYTVVTSSTPDILLSVVSKPSWLNWNASTKTLSGTPNLTISGQYVDVSVTLRASSAALDRQVDQTFTIRVWANNDFAAVPSISMVTEAQGLMMTLTANTLNADVIHVDFGDGAETFADPGAAVEHLYGTPGMYLVRGTASNEYGSDSEIVMFEALADEDEDGTVGDIDNGNEGGKSDLWNKFKDNHAAMLCAIIGIVALAAYVLGVRRPIVLAICVIAFLMAGSFTLADIDFIKEWMP